MSDEARYVARWTLVGACIVIAIILWVAALVGSFGEPWMTIAAVALFAPVFLFVSVVIGLLVALSLQMWRGER